MQGPDNGLVTRFLKEERLPASFITIIDHWYQPLASRLIDMLRHRDRPLVVGINGAQGTGKSTLAHFLSLMLAEQQYRVANLSLDDFYLDSRHRGALARDVHPLLATRGVPGTHDLALAKDLFTELTNPDSRGEILLPRFDKAVDDPRPRSQWERVQLPVNVVIFEGWFVGLEPQASQLLETPVNQLETHEDSDGIWRRYVNNRLTDYQELFSLIDYLVMLRAPSFDCVYEWRSLQEQKLAASAGSTGNRVMDQQELDRFIQHFERLTRHCLTTLPEHADLVFELNRDHQITGSQPPLH